MNIDNVASLRKRFKPFFVKDLKFDVPDGRFDLIWQLLSDVESFMRKSPEYQVVIHQIKETSDGVWFGWDLVTRGRKRETGHDEWLVYRLREIISQHEWDSRYERIA